MPISKSGKPSTQANPGILTWNDFSGGLNADQAAWPLALAENELSEVLNYRYVRQGNLVKLKSRDGLTKYSTGGTAGASILDVGEYYNSPFVVANSILKNYTTSFQTLGTLASTRGRMCEFNQNLFIADGGVLKVYGNATTYRPVLDSDSSYLIDYRSAGPSNPGAIRLYTGSYIFMGLSYLPTAGGGSATIYGCTVTFSIKKVSAPTGTLTVRVYGTDDTLLGTSTTSIDVATGITTAYVNYPFTFALSGIPTGTRVYIGVYFASTSSDSSNYIVIGATGVSSGAIISTDVVTWTDLAAQPYMTISPNFGPEPTFVIQKQNRLYCNHGDYPNRLYYCNANDYNDWSTVNGGGYIIFDGHYKLNGAFVYYDEIYVFADYPKAVYRLTGDSPDEYTLKLMWRDVTAISQDVIQNVGSDLIFQDSRGVISLRTMIQYGDIEKSIISRDKVNNTYVLPYSSQVSGKTISDNQYWLSTTSNYALIYDQEQGIWTRFQFELGTGVTPTAYGCINGLTYIGCSDGNLYYLDYTKSQDNGVDFSLVAKTNWHDLGVLFDKDARFADSVLISANQETYDLELYVNLNTVTPLDIMSLVSLSQNGAYQSPYCGNINQINFNFKQIQAKVVNVASGTGPHWLDRIVVEAAILSHY